MALASVAHVEQDRVTVGVDTHLDTHTAAVKDSRGRTIATRQVAAEAAGYEELLAWARGFGEVEAWGVEGTSSYGKGLTQHLHAEAQVVQEVVRPNRKTRRHRGKSDPVDAEAAARAVQAGEASGLPKSGDGPVEVLRLLVMLYDTATRDRVATVNQIKDVLVTAPEHLRRDLRGLNTTQRIKRCSGWQSEQGGDLDSVTRMVLGTLAAKAAGLDADRTRLKRRIKALATDLAPGLMNRHGFGPMTVARMLLHVGDNPERIVSEAALAKGCGVAPLEASSGKHERHRLSRGGDRQANAALHRVVVVRLKTDPRTIAYMARRLAEGKTKREVIRILKRYVVREVYTALCRKPLKSNDIAS